MSRAKTVTPVEPPEAETTTESAAPAGEADATAAQPSAEGGGAAPTEAAAPAENPTTDSAPTAEEEAAEPEAAETDPAKAQGSGAAPPTEAASTAETGSTTTDSAPAAEEEAAEPEAAPARAQPVWRRLPVLLLAATLVLTGAGVWFTLEARSAAADPAAANLALTDVAGTADVTSAVTLAVNRIFSYSYDRTDVTEKAAAAVLRGPAKDSYDKLFAEVRRKAPEQKLVLSSRVSAIAVQELKNGHARLLVFLDQSAVRADNNATDTAAAQLSVTAEHTTGGWVITELEPR
ncbi:MULTISPECIES: hypothetical protein [Amycolatopsis]|uniref:Mce-associated membrane protein n=1 Tax=Amycolatopsis bullii TaxID=941987 RepID=A0ABQ3KJN0_9PSEU|nr:hypothetical protein [Amycolatopsis bullii]GHG24875.1 hypothetical protein GCM10017567_50060 [Amycolatopsis bullii]